MIELSFRSGITGAYVERIADIGYGAAIALQKVA